MATNEVVVLPGAATPRQGPVRRSPEIGKLAGALAKAQAVMKSAAKNARNPHFGSQYADMESIVEAVREPFAANGLAVIQLPSADGKRVTLTTTLVHGSGEWIEADLTLEARDAGAQAVGSAITYARRYGLSAVAGVAAGGDDDGEHAEGRGNGRQEPPRQQQRKPPPPKPQAKPANGTAGKPDAFAALGPEPDTKGEKTDLLVTLNRLRKEYSDDPAAQDAFFIRALHTADRETVRGWNVQQLREAVEKLHAQMAKEGVVPPDPDAIPDFSGALK